MTAADWNFVFFISSILTLLLYKETSCVERFTNDNDNENVMICYSCPRGLKLDPNTKTCTGVNKDNKDNSLVCTTKNAVLFENMCYNCPKGTRFDTVSKLCQKITPPPPKSQKVCRNTNDILLEGTCYVCGHYKNSFVNPDTLQCNSIVKAYAPSKSYTLKDANGTCDTGYVRDNGTCYQCLGQDRYINGRCNEVIASLPQYTYNAIDSQIDFQTRSRRSTRL